MKIQAAIFWLNTRIKMQIRSASPTDREGFKALRPSSWRTSSYLIYWAKVPEHTDTSQSYWLQKQKTAAGGRFRWSVVSSTTTPLPSRSVSGSAAYHVFVTPPLAPGRLQPASTSRYYHSLAS